MLLPLDRKAFDARFVSDKNDYSSEKDRYRFTEYRATASWIVKYYQHRETHDRLMRHILTN